MYKTGHVHCVAFRYSAVERNGSHGKYRANSTYASNVALFLGKSAVKRHGVWKRETTSSALIDMGIGTYNNIIIFVNCNWIVTRWQWLFYMYTKHEMDTTEFNL